MGRTHQPFSKCNCTVKIHAIYIIKKLPHPLVLVFVVSAAVQRFAVDSVALQQSLHQLPAHQQQVVLLHRLGVVLDQPCFQKIRNISRKFTQTERGKTKKIKSGIENHKKQVNRKNKPKHINSINVNESLSTYCSIVSFTYISIFRYLLFIEWFYLKQM